MPIYILLFTELIRGEPERALNTRVTYGEFAVPMYVCMYVCMYIRMYVYICVRMYTYVYVCRRS